MCSLREGVTNLWNSLMPCFNPRDVREILDMLEEGLHSIPKLEKIEKMKMRNKISRQGSWIFALLNPNAEMVYERLGERLPDIFPPYPYDVKEKLKRLLKEKAKLLRST